MLEVDTRTGQIKVHKIFAASDVGRAINKTNCVQQVQGGVTMGLGIALSEELKFDDWGRIINSNLHDYKIPTFMDVPPIEAITRGSSSSPRSLWSQRIGRSPCGARGSCCGQCCGQCRGNMDQKIAHDSRAGP